jgi:hypothetical protein
VTLKNRLAKLEENRIGAARVIVVECPAGVDYRRALQASGVNAVERDLVVVIADPVAAEVEITVDGVELRQ